MQRNPGHWLAPIEADEAMLAAGELAVHSRPVQRAERVWKAMREAAPRAIADGVFIPLDVALDLALVARLHQGQDGLCSVDVALRLPRAVAGAIEAAAHPTLPIPGTTKSDRPTIKDARDLAQRRDLQAIAIVAVERDGAVTVVSYGETRKKCDSIGDWAQGLWQSAIAAVPFQTRFGWGKGGRATPLTAEEFASLSPTAQDYARRHGGEPRHG